MQGVVRRASVRLGVQHKARMFAMPPPSLRCPDARDHFVVNVRGADSCWRVAPSLLNVTRACPLTHSRLPKTAGSALALPMSGVGGPGGAFRRTFGGPPCYCSGGIGGALGAQALYSPSVQLASAADRSQRLSLRTPPAPPARLLRAARDTVSQWFCLPHSLARPTPSAGSRNHERIFTRLLVALSLNPAL